MNSNLAGLTFKELELIEICAKLYIMVLQTKNLRLKLTYKFAFGCVKNILNKKAA